MDKKKEEQRIIVAPHRHVLLSLCYHVETEINERGQESRDLCPNGTTSLFRLNIRFLFFVSMINL